MKTYDLPASLPGEINKFAEDIQGFQSGAVNPIAFKGLRVAHGIYEQRKPDTHMVRIRCAGGMVTPKQLRKVAEVSKRYGSPHFHVTTRQDLQLHYVDLENVIPVYNELVSVGLSSRGGGGNTVRNIMCSPDSGVRPDETFDVAPYCVELTSRMLKESDSWNLPRKYKMAFSNHDDDQINATITCLGFVAKVKDGQRGFRVFVGGGMGAKPMLGEILYDFVPADRVYYIAKAIKVMFDKHGNRRGRYTSRMKFLWRKLGREDFLRILEEELAVLDEDKNQALVIHEIPNEAQKDIRVAPETVAVDDLEAYALWQKRYVKEQRQSGLYYIKVPLKLGDIENQDGVKLADLLEPFGDNVIRLSLNQNLFLRNIPEKYVPNIWNGLKEIDTLATTPVIISNMVACTGADTCKLGLCLPRGVLPEIENRLLESDLDLDALAHVKIHVSGCPNTCGRHHAADIGFFGRVGRKGEDMYPAYNILAGARICDGESRFAEKLDDICVRHMPQFVEDLLRAYQEKQNQYDSFGAYLDSAGKDDIHQLADKHREVPTYSENKDYYFDWGAEEKFSLLKGQKAECSAGVFDMIDVDAKNIQNHRKLLDGTLDHTATEESLYQIAFSSARMLLVTRGIEGRDDDHIFQSFQTHFIEAHLVDGKFSPVVAMAKGGDREGLRFMQGRVLELGEAIIKLHKSMDDSLRFKNVPEEEPEPQNKVVTPPVAEVTVPATDADQFRDFRGVVCPINFVKTKIALDPMASGETLEIWLDDGEPIANVPNSVALEGHAVLSKEQQEDYWSVLIQKA